MARKVQTRALVTLQIRIDTLMLQAVESGDTALACDLEIASAALETALESRN